MLPVVRTPCVMLWRVIELQQLSRGTMPRGPRAALSWFSTLQYATTTPIQVLALSVPESSELGLLGCARASKVRAYSGRRSRLFSKCRDSNSKGRYLPNVKCVRLGEVL